MKTFLLLSIASFSCFGAFTCGTSHVQLTKPQMLYVIAYGDWTVHPTVLTTLPAYLANFGASATQAVVSAYKTSHSASVPDARLTNQWTYGGMVQVAADPKYGDSTHISTNHSDSVGVGLLIKDTIAAGLLPNPTADRNAVYVVISGAGSAASGTCANQYGCHWDFTSTNSSFVGYYTFTNDMTSGTGYPTVSNAVTGDADSDGVIYTTTHELFEAESFGCADGSSETADLCESGYFGTALTAPSNVCTPSNVCSYNQIIGGTYYLLPLMWQQLPISNTAGGVCRLSLLYASPTTKAAGSSSATGAVALQ